MPDVVGVELESTRLGVFATCTPADPHRDVVAVTVLPAEICRALRSWGEKAFDNLVDWNEVDEEGGQVAAWQEPELFPAEVRAASRSPRGIGRRTRPRVDRAPRATALATGGSS